jgi:peptidoglycan/LPS O-acetylase OafA/YrhL
MIKTHIKELDGLRGIAALMIIFFHFFVRYDGTGDPLLAIICKVTKFGQTGVSLFFVLSGFLITRILLKTKSQENYFKNFFGRRVLRIFPLYYFFLILYYFIVPFLENKSFIPFSDQIYFWTYLQSIAITFNWGENEPFHFWSLSVEEHFYIVWPIFVYFFRSKNILRINLLLIFFAVLLKLWMIYIGYTITYFTLTRMDALLFGALLALVEYKGKPAYINPANYLKMLPLIFISIIVLWVAFTGKHNFFVQIFRFSIIECFYFFLIGFLVFDKGNTFVAKILTSKFLLFTGKISYGLYVFHSLCFDLIDKMKFITTYWIPTLILSLILSYIIASLSFYLFESKFLKFKRFFEYEKPNNIKETEPVNYLQSYAAAEELLRTNNTNEKQV